MQQDQYLAVVDEFSDAVHDLAEGAPQAKRDRLAKATGDLLTALASKATAQSISLLAALYTKLEQNERRFARVGEQLAADNARLNDLEEQRTQELGH